VLATWREEFFEVPYSLATQSWTGCVRSTSTLLDLRSNRILDLDIALLAALLNLLASVDVTCASASASASGSVGVGVGVGASVSAISIAARVSTADICNLRFGNLGGPVYSGADCYPCSCAGQKGWDGRLPETCSYRGVLSVAV
jgi:hypothetical protein